MKYCGIHQVWMSPTKLMGHESVIKVRSYGWSADLWKWVPLYVCRSSSKIEYIHVYIYMSNTTIVFNTHTYMYMYLLHKLHACIYDSDLPFSNQANRKPSRLSIIYIDSSSGGGSWFILLVAEVLSTRDLLWTISMLDICTLGKRLIRAEPRGGYMNDISQS